MQILSHGCERNSYWVEPYSHNTIAGSTCRFFILLAMIFCSSISQGQILDKIKDLPKKVNITVGSPIDNDATKKVLLVVDKIPGLAQTIAGYNARYGNDSV